MIKRGRPAGTSRYTERQRYLIQVMFLYGLGEVEIARLMSTMGVPMTQGQARGQVSSLG